MNISGKLAAVSILLAAAAVFSAGCRAGGEYNASVSVAVKQGSGVNGFNFNIKCDNGFELDRYAALHGGLGHDFADLFQTIPAPANCTVVVTPMLDEKTPALNCRQALQKFAVKQGGTTEISLVAQCDGDPWGGGDIIPETNYPPKITMSVTGRYDCPGNTTAADILVEDPDGDPISISHGVVFYDTSGIPVLPAPDYTLGIKGAVWSLTPVTEMNGHYELSVKASDDHGATRTAIVPVPVVPCSCCEYLNGGVLSYQGPTDLKSCTEKLSGSLVSDTFCK